MSKLSKGFTIIELIVVIAIIAVLATIVSVSVMEYIKKTKDAAIKADMRELIASSTTYIANNGTAEGFCANSVSTKIADGIKYIDSEYAFQCFDLASNYFVFTTDPWTVWAMAGPEYDPNCSSNGWYAIVMGIKNSSGCWCVDSQGSAKDSCGSYDYCDCQ